MLPHMNVSTVMPCVRVDELDHYHFIEEPRRRLPLHHPWHMNVYQNPLNDPDALRPNHRSIARARERERERERASKQASE